MMRRDCDIMPWTAVAVLLSLCRLSRMAWYDDNDDAMVARNEGVNCVCIVGSLDRDQDDEDDVYDAQDRIALLHLAS